MDTRRKGEADAIVETSFEQDGKQYITATQATEAIIAQAKADRDNYKPQDNLRYVGTIPQVVVHAYCQENGVSYEEFMQTDVHVRRILMNPDFKKFRVWEGRF